MERIAGEGVGQETTSMGKVAFASFTGTAVEFYDFYMYGTAAALVFGGVFFPELYGTRLRYSGASVSYNLGGVLGEPSRRSSPPNYWLRPGNPGRSPCTWPRWPS